MVHPVQPALLQPVRGLALLLVQDGGIDARFEALFLYEQLGKRIANHKVQVDVPADFPLVPMDFTLIVQVLVNVLENAVKYSPKDSLIEVSALLLDDANGAARLMHGRRRPSPHE